MSVRGTKLVGRLVVQAVDVVNDRAPELAHRAYQAVAIPLLRADPAGGARAAEARLDGTRDRVAAMAASGRVRPADTRRIQRDLTRTREDVERIAPRLPAVQARGLTRRSAAYTDVLQALDGPVRSASAWNIIVPVAAIAAWVTVLLLVTGPAIAVVAGLAAGAVTTMVISIIRTRRAARVWMGALAAALDGIDVAGVGPGRVELTALDRDRRVLLGRARGSKRLDEPGLAALGLIDGHLDDLLVRLVEGDLEADGAHRVQASIERYLPDTLDPFLALKDPQTVVRGRPAATEVAEQLASIEAGLAELVRRPARVHPEQQLLRQGEFLRSKFGAQSGPERQTHRSG
jgi:hypothetical protein